MVVLRGGNGDEHADDDEWLLNGDERPLVGVLRLLRGVLCLVISCGGGDQAPFDCCFWELIGAADGSLLPASIIICSKDFKRRSVGGCGGNNGGGGGGDDGEGCLIATAGFGGSRTDVVVAGGGVVISTTVTISGAVATTGV